jgi:hypothetical protein
MLEIYCEKVRDLLGDRVNGGGLKVREHPQDGFYGYRENENIIVLCLLQLKDSVVGRLAHIGKWNAELPRARACEASVGIGVMFFF